MRLRNDAHQGRAGELVSLMVKPGTTEAGPEAVLVQLLAMFGGYVGHDAYVRIADDKHFPVISPLIIGTTGSGKGTSLGPVRRVFTEYSQSFTTDNISYGLGSGEGLIERLMKLSEDGTTPRLVVIETEYAAVFRKARRESSILGQVLRQAWDGTPMHVPNRGQNALSVDEHHVPVIGHVTPKELTSETTPEDIRGGTLNRMLMVRTHPQPAVADPRGMSRTDVETAARIISDSLRAIRPGEYRHTSEYSRYWNSVHASYRHIGDSVVDALMGRSRAYVHRLALVYALIDGAAVIGLPHLKAALALVDYAEESARETFAPAVAEKDLEKVRDLILREGPRTASEIKHRVWGGSKYGESHGKFDALVDQGFLVAGAGKRWVLGESGNLGISSETGHLTSGNNIPNPQEGLGTLGSFETEEVEDLDASINAYATGF